MFRLKTLILFVCILFIVSCGKSSESHSFVGEWKATLNSGGRNVPIGIKLTIEDNKYQGKFLILGDTGRGADVKKGFVVKLANIKQSGGDISFIVPIRKGVIDNDSLVFNLKKHLGQLKGTLRENRKSSRVSQVLFSQ